MTKKNCTLCGLETPDPSITDKNTEGVFCCEGCLQVYNILDDLDEEKAETLRKRTINARKGKSEKEVLPESYKESFFKVDGMHCSTCEAFLKSFAERRDGIYRCEASYASDMLKVYYDSDKIDKDTLPKSLSIAGYKVKNIDSGDLQNESDDLVRVIIGGFFGIIGLLIYALFLYPMYIGGEGIVPLSDSEILFFTSNIFVMTSFVLFYTGYPILRGAWVSLSVGKPNMDLLIMIAALSAYLYSILAMVIGSAEVYFDVSMAIIIVVTAGNYFEQKIKSGRRNILSELAQKKLDFARVKRNGKFTKVSADNIKPGDQILVKAGERIPADGIIEEGEGVINEALITGESMPVSKRPGDNVISGTILTQNAITIKTGEEVQSTIDELMRLMWNIQSSRPGKLRIADRIASFFVPAVLVIGVATFGIQMLNGADTSGAVLSALAVLIVSCPCALGLATPLAISSGIRSGLRHNIIFKTSSVFEDKTEPSIIAFDKTGTLTTGNMQLIDRGRSNTALHYASALEQYSSHPLAYPIAQNGKPGSIKVKDFRTHPKGVAGKINGMEVFAGKPEWLIEMGMELSDPDEAKVKQCRKLGHIPVAVAWKGRVRSILEVGDQLRSDSVEIVSKLRENGKEIAIITGDTKEAAQAIQDKLQPNYLFSETSPESKSNILRELRQMGRVLMVGDGSNDAPALAEADLGIAFGDITAIAQESAQIVIPDEKLAKISESLKAITHTRKRIVQNLGWAFLYNAVTIPLAVIGWINPLFAAIAMAASSILVVTNSSRQMPLTD